MVSSCPQGFGLETLTPPQQNVKIRQLKGSKKADPNTSTPLHQMRDYEEGYQKKEIEISFQGLSSKIKDTNIFKEVKEASMREEISKGGNYDKHRFMIDRMSCPTQKETVI